MQFDLKGTRAVVSGSTEGIGYAIARGLAVGGAEVVVNGRSEARTEEAAARLRSEVAGAVVAGVAGDLSTAEGAHAFLARA
ncbi:MAG TPA: SDR family NAD(P)-dependent oxidoreductase, partial [Azospirillaceae bacterium]|nr:SDR family NAD(P)-dependent oxidoreductase [Azospirillaceae bacterium]